MSSRYKVNSTITEGGQKTGLEGIDIPEDFKLPSCGIEDIDRAMFKLFNEDIPMYYELQGDLKKIPIIFGAGERAFLLRRKQPIRDSQGALILPMISILRREISLDEAKAGIAPGNGEITIRKRLAPEDRAYKRLMNPDKLANPANPDMTPSNDATESPSLVLDESKNVWEIITIPVPRFYRVSYEITFWAQYQSQMNNIIEAYMSSYNIRAAAAHRIESPKGYWFVATTDPDISFDNNIDDYTDNERILKATITIHVNGYLIGQSFPGAPNDVRRYVSAPKISFDMPSDAPVTQMQSKIPSPNPEDYVFDDFMSEANALPGSGMTQADISQDSLRISIGDQIKDTTTTPEIIQNPFSDKSVKAVVKSKNLTKGEKVYVMIEDFDK